MTEDEVTRKVRDFFGGKLTPQKLARIVERVRQKLQAGRMGPEGVERVLIDMSLEVQSPSQRMDPSNLAEALYATIPPTPIDTGAGGGGGVSGGGGSWGSGREGDAPADEEEKIKNLVRRTSRKYIAWGAAAALALGIGSCSIQKYYRGREQTTSPAATRIAPRAPRATLKARANPRASPTPRYAPQSDLDKLTKAVDKTNDSVDKLTNRVIPAIDRRLTEYSGKVEKLDGRVEQLENLKTLTQPGYIENADALREIVVKGSVGEEIEKRTKEAVDKLEAKYTPKIDEANEKADAATKAAEEAKRAAAQKQQYVLQPDLAPAIGALGAKVSGIEKILEEEKEKRRHVTFGLEAGLVLPLTQGIDPSISYGVDVFVPLSDRWDIMLGFTQTSYESNATNSNGTLKLNSEDNSFRVVPTYNWERGKNIFSLGAGLEELWGGGTVTGQVGQSVIYDTVASSDLRVLGVGRYSRDLGKGMELGLQGQVGNSLDGSGTAQVGGSVTFTIKFP